MADMADGRWYPTLVTLADGRVLIAAGLKATIGHNRSLEVFTPDGAQGSWEQLPLPPASVFERFPLYPHLFLVRDRLIFFTGGRMDDDESSLPSCLIDVSTHPVAFRPVPGLVDAASRNQSASVLLPPAQDQKVMIIGGATAGGEDDATDSVAVVDLNATAPAYGTVAPLLLPRVHLNAVLLPDRTVFVSGGGLQREGGDTHHRRATARFQCEIYDPQTDTWTLGATAQVARLYHSVALLLPDARVITASGNPDKGHQVAWKPPDENEELHLEVYSPPYLFRGPRPVIEDLPGDWTYGQTVSIATPEAATIRWVSLIRPGVTTHSFDTGQRLVDLPIQSRQQAGITVQVISDPSIAPPGDYMLFLTDTNGVPSVARWVRLSQE
jgi:hypothetical protein